MSSVQLKRLLVALNRIKQHGIEQFSMIDEEIVH